MTNSISVVAMKQRRTEDDMFMGLDPLTAFEVKKDSLATQLTALMIHCGKSRSEMAEELGWQKSRVTKVLSGHNNLTIKTICEFSAHLGYDFDVIFHGNDQPRPKQPWQIQRTEKTNLPIVSLQTLNLPIVTQTALEVAIDLLSGKGKENYFSFNTKTFENAKTFDVTQQALPAVMPTNLISTGLDVPVIHNLVMHNLRR